MPKSGLLFKIIFTLLLLPALAWLAKVGIADFLRLAPCTYIEDVQKGKERLIPARLLVSREQLLTARSWDSSNPLIPEYLGQIAIIRAQLISLSPTLQAAFFREAIDDFEVAIALSPNSAYLWADRMTAGSLLLEVNAKTGRDGQFAIHELAEISIALRRANELGPWEPKVLAQLVKVGALRYTEFSPDVRVLVDGAQKRAKKLGLNA
ncbi:MAG: hypothetical protein NTY60_00915 [Proteobacteria bacterium]|nr:hypothetical protein [Pseudomonadota bacterium]